MLKALLFINSPKLAVPCHYETMQIFYFITCEVQCDNRNTWRETSNNMRLVHLNRAFIDYFLSSVFLPGSSLYKNLSTTSDNIIMLNGHHHEICSWTSLIPSPLNCLLPHAVQYVAFHIGKAKEVPQCRLSEDQGPVQHCSVFEYSPLHPGCAQKGVSKYLQCTYLSMGFTNWAMLRLFQMQHVSDYAAQLFFVVAESIVLEVSAKVKTP